MSVRVRSRVMAVVILTLIATAPCTRREPATRKFAQGREAGRSRNLPPIRQLASISSSRAIFVPDRSLSDDQGGTVRLSNWRGAAAVITFIHTRGPEQIAADMRRALAR